MQDDLKPGWEKNSKLPADSDDSTPDNSTTETTSSEGLDTAVNKPASQEKGEEVIDEKKLEEEFGPPPETTTPEDDPVKLPIHKRPWAWLKGLSTKRKIIYGSLFVVTVATVTVCIVLLTKPAPPIPEFPTYRPPTPTTVPSKLTGLQVDPAINERQVTGVMIENSVFARPQSSLNQAGIVFEAIAEAGITRFLALFQDTQSSYIGPVRSVRPYYVDWCQAFDCALAHVGGSPEALRNIKKYDVKDLDQFSGASYYRRITARYAPHNVYTSQNKLDQYQKSRGYDKSDYTGFEHMLKEPTIAAKDITVTKVGISYPGSTYDVAYTYQTKTNNYARSMAGKPHMSINAKGTLKRNTPKVVVALIAPYSLKGDGYHSSYKTVGNGTVLVFQNGTVVKGTWSRDKRDSHFTLSDANGNPIKLVPGQTWVSVVGRTSDVTFKETKPAAPQP